MSSSSSSRISTRGRCTPRTSSARPSPGPTRPCVTDVYRAREEPVAGVTGKLVVDAALDARPGMRVGYGPTLEDAVAIVAAWARPGDVVLTVGAGDVDRAGPLLLEALG